MKFKNALTTAACLSLFALTNTYAFSNIDVFTGVSTGYSGFANHYQVNTTGSENAFGIVVSNPNNDSSIKYNLNSNGVDGNFYVGLGHAFNTLSFDLRAEVDANLSSNSIKNQQQGRLYRRKGQDQLLSSGTLSLTQKQQYNFGISLMPGFYITENNLFYGRIGYRLGSLKSSASLTPTTNQAYDGPSSFGDGDLGQPGSVTHALNGIELGVGVESTFLSNFSLSAEYDYTKYQSFTTKFASHYSDPEESQVKYTDNHIYTNSPSSNQVNFGLTYYLGGMSHNPNHYLDPIAWLQGKFSHGGVVNNEDQTMIAKNDQPVDLTPKANTSENA